MLDIWRFRAVRMACQMADFAVTMPLVRWTWSAQADATFTPVLGEFRPTDQETVQEMISGRYLLAAKLVDTQRVSPFAVHVDNPAWRGELHDFSWLRHFSDARGENDRRFARTLVLDWIGRNGRFDRTSWTLALTARRVLNWLRHISLLVEDASPDQARTISRSLASQIQSLKFRRPMAVAPRDRILIALALTGAALSDNSTAEHIAAQAKRLSAELTARTDRTGLCLSRNLADQLLVLTEFISVREALAQSWPALADALAERFAAMHLALDTLTLGTGEPAFFNGCGQLPAELVVAVRGRGAKHGLKSGVTGGYGVLRGGASVVIADGGHLPGPPHAARAHASALAFEFSHGSHLVAGNCGPAPPGFGREGDVFRHGSAHSGFTINDESAARIDARGPFAGLARGIGAPPRIGYDAAEGTLCMTTPAYAGRFGVTVKRCLTLISNGTTLVGQDRVRAAPGGLAPGGRCVLRFHLATGARAIRDTGLDAIRIQLKSGQFWTFLWEGARARIEDSVRQSAFFGFSPTKQIVLEADATGGLEISWVITLENG